jgi:hypothetical protein
MVPFCSIPGQSGVQYEIIWISPVSMIRHRETQNVSVYASYGILRQCRSHVFDLGNEGTGNSIDWAPVANGIAVSTEYRTVTNSTDEVEVTNVYTIGTAHVVNAKSRRSEGIDIILSHYSSVQAPKNSNDDVPWYLRDHIAFYIVVSIIGAGIVLGLCWLLFPSLRGFLRERFSKSAFYCRLYYLCLSGLEIADVLSDILWVISLWALEYTDADLSEDSLFGDIQYTATAFLVLSGCFLLGKIKRQLSLIWSRIENDNSHDYLKLQVFGFSIFYCCLLSNDKILEFHAISVEKEAKRSLINDLFGLNRENIFTQTIPSPLANLFLFGAKDNNGKKLNTIWDLIILPINVFYSSCYYRAFFFFLLVLWPISLIVVHLNFGSVILLLLLNIMAYSEQKITIRFFEDIPQLVLNILYLLFLQSAKLNAYSAFSILCSTLLLTKFLVEIISGIGHEISSSSKSPFEIEQQAPQEEKMIVIEEKEVAEYDVNKESKSRMLYLLVRC